jgi:hypothetical protein
MALIHEDSGAVAGASLGLLMSAAGTGVSRTTSARSVSRFGTGHGSFPWVNGGVSWAE